MKDELGFEIMEDKYTERIEGDSKKIELKWTCKKKLTDYFRFDAEIEMKAEKIKEIEVNQSGVKVKTNQGAVEVIIRGILVRDYNGKFETSAFKKFLRSIYEKWVIPSRIEQFEEKLISDCDEFLNQAKAYLDLEGKK